MKGFIIISHMDDYVENSGVYIDRFEYVQVRLIVSRKTFS